MLDQLFEQGCTCVVCATHVCLVWKHRWRTELLSAHPVVYSYEMAVHALPGRADSMLCRRDTGDVEACIEKQFSVQSSETQSDTVTHVLDKKIDTIETFIVADST